MVYTIDEIRRIAAPIAASYGVKRMRLFGSYARGDATENSDVDIRIDCGGIRDLFEMGGLYAEMQEKLKKGLDLVTTEGLDADFLARIRPDEVTLYEQ